MTPDDSDDDGGADSDGSEILFGLPPAHTDHGLPATYFQEGGGANSAVPMAVAATMACASKRTRIVR